MQYVITLGKWLVMYYFLL
ncbi:Protein of unknown function [Bacillus wiedmannii]|uniref:Uncharacterized protein n=1 Tax=Bacillus wiedmannii TaxID=1890302 RepID=A0AB37YMB8_9BACI|nr:Protein of unknown function [Bacillus wiedmannii]